MIDNLVRLALYSEKNTLVNNDSYGTYLEKNCHHRRRNGRVDERRRAIEYDGGVRP